ncbi:hypothetical protein LCGC14_1169490 [marine sediment metagenome]|uniref:Uncharacterized protein n=1 Tax=marine sediment metagenome TaxID=412755 RepID=A0A0F9LQE0_9ZZZZ
MARITLAQWKSANVKRYKDLRDEVKLLAVVDGIDHDSIRLREMREIARIAKLHGINIKE